MAMLNNQMVYIYILEGAFNNQACVRNYADMIDQ